MRHLLVIVAFLIAGITPALADDLHDILEAGVVRVGVCLTAEPAGFRDSAGNPRGYDIDVVTLMAAELGVRLELVEVTSATRIPDLLAGRIDVIACNITATTERARSIAFSFPYLRTGLKLLVQRDAGIDSIDDIGEGTRLVLGRGTTGETFARERLGVAEFMFVENPGDAVLLMRQQDADAYIEDSLAIDYIAKAYPEQLVALPQTYTVDAICFGVRKGNPDLLRWLDLFASIYVSSGRYAEVYGRWWGEPPPPLSPVW